MTQMINTRVILFSIFPILALFISIYIMRPASVVLPILSLLSGAVSQSSSSSSGGFDQNPLTPYTIYAYGINATFIGYGARLTSLYVHDKNNDPREVVVGYDEPEQYVHDTLSGNHTYFVSSTVRSPLVRAHVAPVGSCRWVR